MVGWERSMVSLRGERGRRWAAPYSESSSVERSAGSRCAAGPGPWSGGGQVPGPVVLR